MVLTEEEERERKRIANKQYNNSEKGREIKKKYRESERGKEKAKLRRKTENGKKLERKNKWKGRGLNMENFEEIYERYTMAIFCDICECVLEGNGRNKKCMDHCHLTGEFRNIVCNWCNVNICK